MKPGSISGVRAFVLFSVFMAMLLPATRLALTPNEIMIVANRRVAEGFDLARYYGKKRGIPDENLLVLDLPTGETCRRDDYERRIARPIRERLSAVQPAGRIRCLVMMYGMPLKVAPGMRTEKPAEAGRRLNAERIERDERASLDSELAVVRVADAPVGGWIENPFYPGFVRRSLAISKGQVMMVSRLDGPGAAIVKRMIDDAVLVEAAGGLAGVAYFDARWSMPVDSPQGAYRAYDAAIHRAAKEVAESGRLRVVVDENDALFQPGQCADAALYCGWYHLGTYVDAFKWRRGAVGFHVASSECSTLKRAGSQVWCKRMLEKGVCATIGPVNEPYLQAFPDPALFFGLLAEGVLTLGECYMISLPYLSWQMVLVGDPLYRPF
jgi:uncharacterized protein (TIGR03790 family)